MRQLPETDRRITRLQFSVEMYSEYLPKRIGFGGDISEILHQHNSDVDG